MIRLATFALLLLSSVALASRAPVCALAADRDNAKPEDGRVIDGVYTNPYFGLRYPLPLGWKEGPRPAPPSYSGYYVLNTPAPADNANATILIAAQDAFFASGGIDKAISFAEDRARSVSSSGGPLLDPYEVMVGGHTFVRVEIPGSPLSSTVFATDIRCHVVMFVFTAAGQKLLKELEKSLDRLSLPADEPKVACVKDFVTPQTILRKVEPTPVGPFFLKIPVRMIIGADGRVNHIDVIRAFPQQRQSIEYALAQWKLKPYQVNDQPAEVETGLLFEFKPTDAHE